MFEEVGGYKIPNYSHFALSFNKTSPSAKSGPFPCMLKHFTPLNQYNCSILGSDTYIHAAVLLEERGSGNSVSAIEAIKQWHCTLIKHCN